jgi:hypothetical protein
MERHLEAERGRGASRRQRRTRKNGDEEARGPQPGPTLTRGRKAERGIEGHFAEQRKGHRGYTYWRTRTRSWYSSRNRDRGHKYLSQGHGKAVGNESFPGRRIGPDSHFDTRYWLENVDSWIDQVKATWTHKNNKKTC